MKSIISMIMLSFIWMDVHAAPIQVHYVKNHKQAIWVKEIFINEYNIPDELIQIKKVTNCEGIKESGKIDLCLTNSGDLLIVSADRKFISDSLKIFQAP